MTLEKILTISGKPGLYQLENQTRSGFLATSLVDGKKISVNAKQNVSILSEIAIYTLTEELPLSEVFTKISKKENGGEAISHKSTKDELELLFSANKGTSLGSFKKVASGGEMSRIMLAIKAIIADFSKLPTILFDEIDTGVSGEIALKMGEIMKKMSINRQVFAITHLPQIASKGDSQYKVSKEKNLF